MSTNKITNLVKQIIELNQRLINNIFDAMVLINDQLESLANGVLDLTPGLPAEGRRAIENWSEAFKEGRKSSKQQIDNGFEQAEKLLAP
jgi:hypothetical protein